MKNNQKAVTRKRRILLIIGAILLAIILLFTVKHFIESPRDIGPKLSYVGKEDFGCLPFPFFFFCDSPRYSTYYFATDMSGDEIKGYFKKASFDGSNVVEPDGTDNYYHRKSLPFNLEAGKLLVIDYYSDTSNILKSYPHLKSNKKYLISTQDYALLRSAY